MPEKKVSTPTSRPKTRPKKKSFLSPCPKPKMHTVSRDSINVANSGSYILVLKYSLAKHSIVSEGSQDIVPVPTPPLKPKWQGHDIEYYSKKYRIRGSRMTQPTKRAQFFLSLTRLCIVHSVSRKKSANVYKYCPKTISIEK